ncbi:extracellular solute-binding protein [Halosegnis rubeus]|jgi:sn-glycerol 3-phosphate transport system substrate-binding protein|nr:extracellular solute-binding protein [Halosegnis rubeus]
MDAQQSRRSVLKTTGLAATVGLAGMAGCSSLGGGTGGGNAAQQINFENLGNREASENVELEFWISIGAEDLVQGIVDRFNEQSDSITVSVSNQGNYNEVWNQTQQAQTAGSPPGIVHLNAVSTLPAWAEDVVIPAEDLIGPEIDRSNFVSAVSNYYVIDDTLLGLPFGVSTVACSYNRSAFEQAGLASHPDDVELTTFDDWQTAADAVMAETEMSSGVTWPQIGWFYETFFATQGQNVVNNENGRASPATASYFDSDAARRMYEWNSSMYESNRYQLSADWSEARQAFLSGQVAVQMDSSAALAALSGGAREAGFEHGVGTVPSATTDGREGPIIGGGALFVPTGIDGAKLKAAAELMLWLSQPEQQAEWHMSTGYYPLSREAITIAEEQGFYEESPQFRRAFEQFASRPETPATAGAFTYDHGEMRTEIVNGLDRLYGGNSVEDVVSSTKSNVDDVLARASDADPRSE